VSERKRHPNRKEVAMADQSIAREAFYSGRVQGVGFRYTAKRIAQGFAVQGFVRNLVDGRVQLLAIGLAGEVDRYLAALGEAMQENIQEAAISDVAVPPGYTSFEVRA